MDGASLRTGLLTLLFTLVLAVGCAEEPAVEPQLRPVRVEPVYATGGTRVRSFSGVARADVESRLSFKVAGTIQRLDAKVGDAIQAGQLLARLDPRDFELQVEDVEASLKRAKARARNAAANLERVRGLYEDNNASQNEYDAARAEYDSSAADVSSMEKKLELARAQLSYTRLVSPVSGAISAVRAEVNENVSPGQTVLVLTSGGQPEVEIAVPEAFIARVRALHRVTVTFDALPGREFDAAVSEVGVASTGLGTTFPVSVRLIDPSPEILPGMAAEVSVRFETRNATERMVVPPFAVAEDRDGRFVYVAEPREGGLAVARRRPVRVGDLTSEGLEILEGLEEGDLLITAGVSRIEDGLQVKLPVGGEAEPGR
jgi:RND family efflux transporter MFP subunit